MPNPRNFLVGTILDNFSSHLIICLFFWVLQLVLLNVSPHPLYNLMSRHLIPSDNISKFFRQFHRSCISSGLPGAPLLTTALVVRLEFGFALLCWLASTSADF